MFLAVGFPADLAIRSLRVRAQSATTQLRQMPLAMEGEKRKPGRMIRRHAALLQAMLTAADASAAAAAVVLAANLRFGPRLTWTSALDTSLPDPDSQ